MNSTNPRSTFLTALRAAPAAYRHLIAEALESFDVELAARESFVSNASLEDQIEVSGGDLATLAAIRRRRKTLKTLAEACVEEHRPTLVDHFDYKAPTVHIRPDGSVSADGGHLVVKLPVKKNVSSLRRRRDKRALTKSEARGYTEIEAKKRVAKFLSTKRLREGTPEDPAKWHITSMKTFINPADGQPWWRIVLHRKSELRRAGAAKRRASRNQGKLQRALAKQKKQEEKALDALAGKSTEELLAMLQEQREV